jgi:sulfate permease, SulP family
MEKSHKNSPLKFFFKNLIITPLAGLVVGIIAISNTITLGALVFSESLPGYIPYGIGAALFSGLVVSILVTLFGTTPGLVAYPQAAIATICALLVTHVHTAMPETATTEETFSTIVAALWLSTFTTGLIFFIFGRLKLGKAFRFMPYPVFGGFLAGLGWLIIKGGLKMMVTLPLNLSHIIQWIGIDNFYRWFPGVVLALIIFIIQRRTKHPLVLPIMLFVSAASFYIVIYLTNIPFEHLSEQGWLLGTFGNRTLWLPVDLRIVFQQANWAIISQNTLTFVTITFTSLIGTLFNCSGIELIAKEDIRLDHELQVSGFANMLASLGGGIIGYHSVSLSTVSHKFGLRNRVVGLVAAGLVGITLFYGAVVLSYVPRFLVGGLLVYLGISFLYKWVIESWKLLSKAEYLVLIMILIVISTFGFLAGVMVGVVATAILFAISYSRIDIIKSSLTGKNFHSNFSRSSHHYDYLQAQGESLGILKLQGFIFFGTAFNLMHTIRTRIDDSQKLPLRYLVLDFRLVNGVDSSALNSFMRIRYLAEKNDFLLAISGLSPEIEGQLITEKILIPGNPITQSCPDMDRAVELCENEMLATDKVTYQFEPPLKSQLTSGFPDEVDIEDFFDYLERKEIAEKTVMIEAGAPPLGLFFIEYGEVTVQLATGDGETLRLRTMGAGTIVGELGVYLGNPASAEVIAESDSIVHHLSIEALTAMESEQPKIAAAFHKYMAAMLSKRLIDTNTTLQALLD